MRSQDPVGATEGAVSIRRVVPDIDPEKALSGGSEMSPEAFAAVRDQLAFSAALPEIGGSQFAAVRMRDGEAVLSAAFPASVISQGAGR